MAILIVKTSSLGDIIQSFGVLNYLHQQFPGIQIDWVVESSLSSIVEAHPLVRRAILLDSKKIGTWVKSLRALRREKYDAVFDLQKNTKSGLVTAWARSPIKVGFGSKTVREWPNVLFTNRRFNIPTHWNIREQYVGLLKAYYGDESPTRIEGVRLKAEGSSYRQILEGREKPFLMICPGSKWVNKQLPIKTWIGFLALVKKKLGGTFFFMWGSGEERGDCVEMQKSLGGVVVDKLPIGSWQNLMCEMDFLIGVDSSALHLCGTTETPSFSLFGPTAPEIFKPFGEKHGTIRGVCPFGKQFLKQCPVLRSCPSGACIRDLEAERIFGVFDQFQKHLKLFNPGRDRRVVGIDQKSGIPVPVDC